MSHEDCNRRAISAMRVALLGFGLLAFAQTGNAADVDYAEIVKTKILKCLHPTVSPEKATVEVVKPATKNGDVSTTRYKVFYEGLVKKNAMELDLLVRQAGSIRQMKVNVLSDSGTGGGSCALAKNWGDF